MAYPVEYLAPYEQDRNRLTVFFRIFMVIPHAFVGFFLAIGLFFTSIATWFAVVITGRYPQGLYDFHAGCLRFLGRYAGYANLQTDAFPPFGLDDEPAYPVRIEIAPRQESYSRLLAFFRIIPLIAVYFIYYALTIVSGICAVVMWFVAVITGRGSRALHDGIGLGVGYTVRAAAYWLNMTDRFPTFSNGDSEPLPAAGYGGSLGAGEPAWSPSGATSTAAPDFQKRL